MSSARGKRKRKKQNEHNVSFAFPNVKIRLQSAVGKQSDRMFIVDSGASFHQMSSMDLTMAAKKNQRILATPLELNTANGEISVEWEAKIRVKEIGNELVTVLLLNDTPAVLSLGRLCDTNGFTFHWSSTEVPYLQKPSGRKIYCPVEQNVPCRTLFLLIEQHQVQPSQTRVQQKPKIQKLLTKPSQTRVRRTSHRN